MITNSNYTKIRGNPYITFDAIILYAALLWLLYILLIKGFTVADIYIPAVLIILYRFCGVEHYYFHLTDKELIVKNHYFFWIKKHYDLSQIRDVLFGVSYRFQKKSITVITKDNKEKMYYAESLRDKDWKELIEKLTELKVYMRKEHGFDLDIPKRSFLRKRNR